MEPRLRQRVLHGDGGEMGGGFILGGMTALLDAGELDDLRLGHLRKRLQDLAVRAHVVGHRKADAGDANGFGSEGLKPAAVSRGLDMAAVGFRAAPSGEVTRDIVARDASAGTGGRDVRQGGRIEPGLLGQLRGARRPLDFGFRRPETG